MLKLTLALASLSGAALGAVFNVQVGNGGLKFNPESITASMGDTVNFHFYNGDHAVASSTFSAPCMPAGGVFSGFINPTSGLVASKMFQYTVSSTDPSFFYCPQTGHCQAGMVFAINPSSSETVAAYAKAAGNADESSPPSAVGGGQVVPNSDSGPVASSAASSAMMSSTMASSAMKSSAMATSMMMSPVPASTPAAASTSASPVATMASSTPSAVVSTPPTYSGAANANGVNMVMGGVVMVANAWGWLLM